VQCLKYENGRYLRPELVRLLAGMEGGAELFAGRVLVPVPLHAVRLRKRGYNQADLLAEAVAMAWPRTRTSSLLERTRATPSQTRLQREERKRNMRGAFVCRRPMPPQDPFVLIDDVLTTGATLAACAEALRAGGARRISAFTLAHG
jgi:ComF family protein